MGKAVSKLTGWTLAINGPALAGSKRFTGDRGMLSGATQDPRRTQPTGTRRSRPPTRLWEGVPEEKRGAKHEGAPSGPPSHLPPPSLIPRVPAPHNHHHHTGLHLPPTPPHNHHHNHPMDRLVLMTTHPQNSTSGRFTAVRTHVKRFITNYKIINRGQHIKLIDSSDDVGHDIFVHAMCSWDAYRDRFLSLAGSLRS